MVRVEVKSKYICRSCGRETELVIEANQPTSIQCPVCRGKILYKKRTTEPLVFDCR
ncbi:hypothetical protein J8273_8198 [Carpediemonas membranifera]|uniref:DNA-directed RNA polymerase subunit P n=1 Tax=Carpediemonas membranifera TaxID=201153 RepID=A0A8J6DZ26_9EUKA|nr:hypothetical protein J8273_8198 [Carpediemonas membranifera]|eukprot:KAG9390158.1 hypothetical protein J8273_8198 [Carpediemonas membranifera]